MLNSKQTRKHREHGENKIKRTQRGAILVRRDSVCFKISVQDFGRDAYAYDARYIGEKEVQMRLLSDEERARLARTLPRAAGGAARAQHPAAALVTLRHCEERGDEASHRTAELDCFAMLAMTT